MDNEYELKEEYTLLPEYTAPPEYTPEYPDVSFFQESSVTAREENIFQGETPPGEEDPNALREEKKKEQSRFAWLRSLFASALRGGAALLTLLALIGTTAVVADAKEGTPVATVKEWVNQLKEPALKTPQDYGPKELLALWRGDPDAPHKYDLENAHVRREATCLQDGLIEYLCTECGLALKETVKGAHSAAAPVRENETAPDCTHEGSYDSVVYCTLCHAELSRETHILAVTGHTPAESVVENEVGALCTEGGRYEEVVYCSVCGEELSRTAVVQASPGHIPADAVTENETPSTCTEEGAAEEVVYCKVCGEELSRESVILPLAEHTEGEPEEEDRIEATCTEDGGYDEVICCAVCGEELSREHIVLEAAGHTEGEPEEEDRTEATCTEEGGYDEVILCAVCGEELSRTHVVLEATGHSAAASVRENESAATCTADGGYDEVVYCSVCDAEISRTHTVLAATGHRASASVRENESAATCIAAGGYDEVVYCSVCHAEISRAHTVLAALGHSYGRWTTYSSPTCTATGIDYRLCMRCSEYETRTTAATGHTPGDPVRQENRVEATCTTDGSYDSMVVHCTVCNEVLSKEHHVIPAHGHSFGMTYDDDSVLYCGYGCDTPAVTIRFSSSPSGNGTFYYTLNSDFVSQLNYYNCDGMMHVETADSSRRYVNDEEDREWNGSASGSLLGLTWSSYGSLYPSGSRLTVRFVFIFWDTAH